MHRLLAMPSSLCCRSEAGKQTSRNDWHVDNSSSSGGKGLKVTKKKKKKKTESDNVRSIRLLSSSETPIKGSRKYEREKGEKKKKKKKKKKRLD